eukprot:172304-Hanusia_phi.AAC.2
MQSSVTVCLVVSPASCLAASSSMSCGESTPSPTPGEATGGKSVLLTLLQRVKGCNDIRDRVVEVARDQHVLALDDLPDCDMRPGFISTFQYDVVQTFVDILTKSVYTVTLLTGNFCILDTVAEVRIAQLQDEKEMNHKNVIRTELMNQALQVGRGGREWERKDGRGSGSATDAGGTDGDAGG